MKNRFLKGLLVLVICFVSVLGFAGCEEDNSLKGTLEATGYPTTYAAWTSESDKTPAEYKQEIFSGVTVTYTPNQNSTDANDVTWSATGYAEFGAKGILVSGLNVAQKGVQTVRIVYKSLSFEFEITLT